MILQKGILLFWGTISEFFSNFPHYSVIKVDQIELTKIDETDMTFMQSTDTGDGIAVICSDLQIQEETKKILDKKKRHIQHNKTKYIYNLFSCIFARNIKQ